VLCARDGAIRLSASALIALLCAYAPGDAIGQDAPAVGVVVLVDMSRSFAPLTAEDKRALEAIRDAVGGRIQREWDQPVMVFWSTIGSFSPGVVSPCPQSILYQRRLVPRKGDREVSDFDTLKAKIQACIERLTGGAVKPEEGTDISGGVQHAAEILRPVVGKKIIIIVSDFVESLPSGRDSVPVRLSGEYVAMIYKPEITDERKRNQMYERLNEWQTRLKSAGANVCSPVAIKGILPASIERCLPK